MMDLFYLSSFSVCEAQATSTSRPKSMVQLEPIGVIIKSKKFSHSNNVGSPPTLTQYELLQPHPEMWHSKCGIYDGKALTRTSRITDALCNVPREAHITLGPYSKSFSQWYNWSLFELL